jgi:hypothetical protein
LPLELLKEGARQDGQGRMGSPGNRATGKEPPRASPTHFPVNSVYAPPYHLPALRPRHGPYAPHGL